MILYSLLPFFKKERINYNSETEQNKISYKKLLSEVKEKQEVLVTEILSITDKKERNKKLKDAKTSFKKVVQGIKRKIKDSKLKAKINFMAAVSRNKETKENVKLIKKSQSNLHRVLYNYAKLPYEEKKNSIVVQEISPSKEIEFSIKKRIYNELDTYGDKLGDRILTGEKDILFTTIRFGLGTEKIPMVFRYSGQCVPIFLDKVRDDTYDKFSNENEHRLEALCAKVREIRAPNQFKFKINRTVGMVIIAVILMGGYLIYKYYNGGF